MNLAAAILKDPEQLLSAIKDWNVKFSRLSRDGRAAIHASFAPSTGSTSDFQQRVKVMGVAIADEGSGGKPAAPDSPFANVGGDVHQPCVLSKALVHQMFDVRWEGVRSGGLLAMAHKHAAPNS